MLSNFSILAALGAAWLQPSPASALPDDEPGYQGCAIEHSQLTLPDGVCGAVALDGDLAVIGDPNERGEAYVFDVSSGQLLRKLRANTPEPDTGFGHCVALQGDLVVVGAPWEGAAYLFRVSTGQLLHELLASDGSADDGFGWSVAISGDVRSPRALGARVTLWAATGPCDGRAAP
jgi:hypothetical protein